VEREVCIQLLIASLPQRAEQASTDGRTDGGEGSRSSEASVAESGKQRNVAVYRLCDAGEEVAVGVVAMGWRSEPSRWLAMNAAASLAGDVVAHPSPRCAGM
jgi:hypothetical protein